MWSHCLYGKGAAGVALVTVGKMSAGTFMLKDGSMWEQMVMFTYPLVVQLSSSPMPVMPMVHGFRLRPRYWTAYSLIKLDCDPESRIARYGINSSTPSLIRTFAVGKMTVLNCLFT